MTSMTAVLMPTTETRSSGCEFDQKPMRSMGALIASSTGLADSAPDARTRLGVREWPGHAGSVGLSESGRMP